MTYLTLDQQLTGRNKNSKKIDNNTYAQRRDNAIAIKLHDTDVVTYLKDGSIVLNSGGWQTLTTKDRINNQIAPEYISQRNGIWYFSNGSLFYDGVIIKNGKVVKPRKPDQYEKKLKAIKKQARAYAKEFAKNSKDIALPSVGDCWGCAFTDKNGNEAMGTSHIYYHFKEKYYVPSLLFNAIKAKGYFDPALIYHMAQSGDFWDTEELVYKYVVKQLQKEL